MLNAGARAVQVLEIAPAVPNDMLRIRIVDALIPPGVVCSKCLTPNLCYNLKYIIKSVNVANLIYYGANDVSMDGKVLYPDSDVLKPCDTTNHFSKIIVYTNDSSLDNTRLAVDYTVQVVIG